MKGAVTPAGQSTQPSAPGGEQGELLSLQDEKPHLHLLSSPRASWDQVKGRVGISHETRGCEGQLSEGPGKSGIRRKACTLQMRRGAWLPARAMGQQPQHSSPGCKERPPACLGPSTAAGACSRGSASPNCTVCSTTSSPNSTTSPKTSPKTSASFSSPHSLKLHLPRSHN